jgi:Domain of unknown function (DUF4145)
MICPHCSIAAHIRWSTATSFPTVVEKPGFRDEFDYEGTEIAYAHCPECAGLLVVLRYGQYFGDDYGEPPDSGPGRESLRSVEREERIYPLGNVRPLALEVPETYRVEFLEACRVEGVSPKASAALSRRLLQQLLRDELNLNSTNLAVQVQEFLSLPGIPSYLSEAVDAIRNVGNFAAHPLKETNTGAIVDVEPGEASWLLDVLEAFFDFVFVQPKRLESKKKDLNEKLRSLGKSPMRGSSLS